MAECHNGCHVSVLGFLKVHREWSRPSRLAHDCQVWMCDSVHRHSSWQLRFGASYFRCSLSFHHPSLSVFQCFQPSPVSFGQWFRAGDWQFVRDFGCWHRQILSVVVSASRLLPPSFEQTPFPLFLQTGVAGSEVLPDVHALFRPEHFETSAPSRRVSAGSSFPFPVWAMQPFLPRSSTAMLTR